jgi:hypothetical protein
MKIPRTDAHHPDLRLGQPLAKSISRGDFSDVDFIFTGVNIEGNEFAVIFSGKMGTDLAVVKSIAATGEFLLAVAALDSGHDSLLGRGFKMAVANPMPCFAKFRLIVFFRS